jgi:hypothetical protein
MTNPQPGSELPVAPRTDSAGRDRVEESSKESFPASDPPAWAHGHEPPPAAPADRRSEILHGALGRQVVLEYETGTRIAGVALAVRGPRGGRVDFLILGDAVLFDPEGVALEHNDRLVVCVGNLVRFHLEERAEGRDVPEPGTTIH